MPDLRAASSSWAARDLNEIRICLLEGQQRITTLFRELEDGADKDVSPKEKAAVARYREHVTGHFEEEAWFYDQIEACGEMIPPDAFNHMHNLLIEEMDHLFHPPNNSCCRPRPRILSHLEDALHRQIYLENNVFFPRLRALAGAGRAI